MQRKIYLHRINHLHPIKDKNFQSLGKGANKFCAQAKPTVSKSAAITSISRWHETCYLNKRIVIDMKDHEKIKIMKDAVYNLQKTKEGYHG